MDLTAATKQMKALKAKAKAARKAGKSDSAKVFRAGAARLTRKLRAAKRNAKPVEKKEEAAAAAVAS